MLNRYLPLLLTGVLLLTAIPAYDQPELIRYELEETIVTGSKVPQTPGNVTQKIEIITATDFEDMILGNSNLAEILSHSPGNFANVLSRNDANWGSSGGLANTYKGYMLDGLPIDAFIDLQSLDPWAFARIEDQRGSASVLYPTYLAMDFAGNQSPLAGTANFILRERVDAARTRASLYTGSYNTVGARFYHQRVAGNFHWFAGGHYEDSDYTDYGTADSWLNMIDNPAYEKTRLYARGTYFIDGDEDHRLAIYAHRNWHTGTAGRPNRGFAHTYTTLNSHYLRPLQDNLVAQMRLGYRDYVRTWEEDHWPASIALRQEDRMLQTIVPVDLSVSYRHGIGGLLTVGADYQVAWYETASQADELRMGNDGRAMHVGVYAQEELAWNDFVFRLGGRFNHIRHDIYLLDGVAPGADSESWNKVLGSAGVRYNPFNTLSVYSNVGTSFRAPSLKSVGGTIPLSDMGRDDVTGHLPNPDLDPESGLSVDLGASFMPAYGLVLGARAFLIQIDDQIVHTVVTQSGSQSQDVNAGKTETYGLELELQHSLTGWLQWYANYTLTQSEIENKLEPDKDGARMNFVPEHVVNVGAQAILPGEVYASARVQWFSSIHESISIANPGKLDAYELVTARLEKRFTDRDGRQLRVFVEPYNLTNNTFEMPWGFQDPGFSANGGLSVRF